MPPFSSPLGSSNSPLGSNSSPLGSSSREDLSATDGPALESRTAEIIPVGVGPFSRAMGIAVLVPASQVQQDIGEETSPQQTGRRTQERKEEEEVRAVGTTGKASGQIFKDLGATTDKALPTLPLGSQALGIREKKWRLLGPTLVMAKGAKSGAHGRHCAVAQMPKNVPMVPE